jgi:DNA-binding NtrC family response regulator
MKRILIVDDEESIRFTFSAFLQGAGFETVLAADGRQGLQQCMEQCCDLAVLDIILPRGSGFTLLGDIRRQGITMPVILITGRPNRQSLERAAACGVADYLIKPVRKEQIIAAVRQALHLGTNSSLQSAAACRSSFPPTPSPNLSPAMRQLLHTVKLRS